MKTYFLVLFGRLRTWQAGRPHHQRGVFTVLFFRWFSSSFSSLFFSFAESSYWFFFFSFSSFFFAYSSPSLIYGFLWISYFARIFLSQLETALWKGENIDDLFFPRLHFLFPSVKSSFYLNYFFDRSKLVNILIFQLFLPVVFSLPFCQNSNQPFFVFLFVLKWSPFLFNWFFFIVEFSKSL